MNEPEHLLAVVPLKSPERAKTRLSAMLGPAQRRQLQYLLAERVIRALQATAGIDTVAVVTASSEVAAFARALGARVLVQAVETGTAGAFNTAVQSLRRHQASQLLMISGDLPLITPAALQRLLDRRLLAPHAIVVADRHGVGSNALLCAPPQALPPCFGTDSLRRHLSTAREAGVAIQVMQDPALSLDLDLPADFEALRLQCGSCAEALLAALQAAPPTAESSSGSSVEQAIRAA
ncbi:2-phospho-L-lactate guanylyltransferase [Hydrocarboniphaga sp.]|uniref:2-phospho-L-lactate guanylyltransferase n=1 Tax=Hydrocarboniphaga sp. TaxID=2033016 RepID=UPI003D0F5214